MINERLCSRFANLIQSHNPKLADKLINKYSYDSGIDASFLDVLDAVIGLNMHGWSFDDMTNLA